MFDIRARFLIKLARSGKQNFFPAINITNQLNAKSDFRFIYTSDFRAQFHSKLVPFTEYNYFYI